MSDHTKVYKIWNDLLDDEPIMNDRREYEPDQLERMYDLTEYDAALLAVLIKGHFEPGVYSLSDLDPTEVVDMIGESEHEGFDGWSESDKVVIIAFLYDIVSAVKSERVIKKQLDM